MMRRAATFALLAGAFAAEPARAGDTVAVSATAGYLDATATVDGHEKDGYRFKGVTANAAFFFAGVGQGHDHQLLGLFGRTSLLSNTYTEDDAKETMKINDVGVAWQGAAASAPMNVQLGLGVSRVLVEQEQPTPHQDIYTGAMADAAVEVGFLGTRGASLTLRLGVEYHAYAHGKDALNPDAKMLPFSVWGVPLSVGIQARL